MDRLGQNPRRRLGLGFNWQRSLKRWPQLRSSVYHDVVARNLLSVDVTSQFVATSRGTMESQLWRPLNVSVREQILDPRFVLPVPRYKIVARDPETVCADRQKYAEATDPCSRPTPPTPRCWTRYTLRLAYLFTAPPKIGTTLLTSLTLCSAVPNRIIWSW